MLSKWQQGRSTKIAGLFLPWQSFLYWQYVNDILFIYHSKKVLFFQKSAFKPSKIKGFRLSLCLRDTLLIHFLVPKDFKKQIFEWFHLSKLDITFLKTYPFFQKIYFFQLSLVIRNYSTKMYFERKNKAQRRLIM